MSVQKPVIIGITGGIGGGKSTFSAFLRDCGELVFDTDVEAKKLQDEDRQVIEEIKKLFGKDIYTDKGLNRAEIARIVFSDKDKLLKLNQIIHPKVKKNFTEWAKRHQDSKFLFMECAILYEGGFDAYVDKVVVITAPENVRIERVIKRDGLNEQQVVARIKNQTSDEVKINRADWVVNTDNCGKSIDCVRDFMKIIENE